jgi:exonuclease III
MAYNDQTNMNNLSILTLNCQGLRALDNRNVLSSWLNCVKPDIVCLQETHSTFQDAFLSWVSTETVNNNNYQQYAVVSSPGRVRSCGVAVLFKPSLQVVNQFFHDKGRLQIITFIDTSSESSSFQLVNVYGPNRKKDGDEFFESIFPQVDSSFPIVICGDFNIVVNPDMHRYGCNSSSSWAYNGPRSLRHLTEQLELKDVWRLYHPNERRYTWHRTNNGLQASRLDMFWISSFLQPHVIDVDIYPFFRSDDSYVFLRLTLPSLPQRGPGVWKFNASLLQDDLYAAKVHDFWKTWQHEKDTFPSLAVWWDAGKKRLRDLTRRYSKQQVCGRRSHVTSLQNTLFHLERRRQNGDDVLAYINEVKSNLEQALLHEANGAQHHMFVQIRGGM